MTLLETPQAGRYGVIMADPPWLWRARTKEHNERSAAAHYPVMDLAAIQALPVADIAAKDCALFLWVTDPLLPEGLETMKAWGFTFKTVAFYWTKRNRDGSPFAGMGYWTRANPEQCLLGVRGRPVRQAKDVRRWIDAPRREHSRKPDLARARIERLMGLDVPRLEMFSRASAGGWDAWGFDVGQFDPR